MVQLLLLLLLPSPGLIPCLLMLMLLLLLPDGAERRRLDVHAGHEGGRTRARDGRGSGDGRPGMGSSSSGSRRRLLLLLLCGLLLGGLLRLLLMRLGGRTVQALEAAGHLRLSRT